MRCPWCSNTNFPPRTRCAHCNEDLFPAMEEDELDLPPEEEDDEHAAVVLARLQSAAISVVTLAVLTLGAWTCFDHWPKEPPLLGEPIPVPSITPTPDPAKQFTAMNALLKDARATRSHIPPTLGSCLNVSSDADTLEGIVQERTDQAAAAAKLETSVMPDGDALKEALVAMTQATENADEQYLSWAQDAQSSGSCFDVPASGDIADANQTAADAKRAFVKLWNAEAPTYGKHKYRWTDF
jgi:hypothetical protein